ncbi:hypothetical protein PMAYCL1PPCAC_25950, partial [Pristionchus mayeri]
TEWHQITYGKPFLCFGGGVFDFGNITGCTLPDGSSKPFWYAWVVDTEVHQCKFQIKGNTITTYIDGIGCVHGTNTIWRGYIFDNGKEVKKCDLVGDKWMMRDLTTAEASAYLESKNVGGSSKVIGGSGGSGAGGSVVADTKDQKPQKPSKDAPNKPAPGMLINLSLKFQIFLQTIDPENIVSNVLNLLIAEQFHFVCQCADLFNLC